MTLKHKIICTAVFVFTVSNESFAEPQDLTSDASSDATQSGRMAHLDPVTGELISEPTAEQFEQNQEITQAPEPANIIEHEDGMVEVVLKGQMHSSLQGTVSCDGHVKTQHRETPDGQAHDDLVDDVCDN